MNIDKYYRSSDDGFAGYFTADNIYCGETPQEFIQTSVFGHCCCGNVDDSLQYVKSLLEKISRGEWRRDSSSPAESYVVYSLDKLGLLEHGCALPGWLTTKGKELLADLTEIYQ